MGSDSFTPTLFPTALPWPSIKGELLSPGAHTHCHRPSWPPLWPTYRGPLSNPLLPGQGNQSCHNNFPDHQPDSPAEQLAGMDCSVVAISWLLCPSSPTTSSIRPSIKIALSEPTPLPHPFPANPAVGSSEFGSHHRLVRQGLHCRTCGLSRGLN